MNRFFLVLLTVAAALWVFLRPLSGPGGHAGPVNDEGVVGEAAGAAGELDPVERGVAPPVGAGPGRTEHSTATEIPTATVPGEREPRAQDPAQDPAQVLRFVVQAPAGEVADPGVRLVIEAPQNQSIDRPNIVNASAQFFVLDPLGLGDWRLAGEATGEFGDVLELPLPANARTRVRMEARCGILAPFESTDWAPGPEPHTLHAVPAGEVRFRLVDGSGGQVELASLAGSTLALGVSPGTGFRSAGGQRVGQGAGQEAGPLALRFDESLRASAWGVAGGARVIPGANQILAVDGSKVRVTWAGTALGDLPHGEVEVEVVPLRTTEVRVIADATGEPIPRARVALRSSGGGGGDWLYAGKDGVVLVESSPAFRGTLKIVADGFSTRDVAFEGHGPGTPLSYGLAEAPRIRGTVVDLEGSPVPGVELCDSFMPSGRRATTDAMGRFSFPRPAHERLELRLLSAGSSFGDRVLRDQAGRVGLFASGSYGREEQDIIVTLLASVRVFGRAVDGAGEPLSRGKVLATLKSPPGTGPPHPRVQVAKVRRGAYALEHLVPGRWELVLWRGDVPCAPQVVEVLKDTELDLEFVASGAELSGLIVDEAGLPHTFSILLEGPEGTRSVRSDAAGRYRIAGLTAGQYWLSASSNEGSAHISEPSYLCLAACTISADEGVFTADCVAARAVSVAITVCPDEGGVGSGHRAEAIDAASGRRLRWTSSSMLRTTHFHPVSAGAPVILRLLDGDGNVVRQEQHTFQAGSRPIVDLSPR